MMSKKLPFAGAIALLLVATLYAATAVAAEAPNGLVDDSVDMQAPTQNEDGSTIDDLDYLTLFWGFASRTYVGSQQVPATAGATVTAPVQISVTGNFGDTVTVFFTGTATDRQGNESVQGNEIQRDYLIVDSGVPQPPTVVFTVPIAWNCLTPLGQGCSLLPIGG